MTEPRLATSVLVSALIRRAEAEGGFGAVLARGDPTAGAILVILLERGQNPRLLERVAASGGEYQWRSISSRVPDEREEVPRLIAKRRQFDPDLWAIELDVPSAERFAAEMDEVR